MFSISPHNCSYCLTHSIPIDMKVPLESKSQIFISFSLIVHAGRNEISSKIKFWIIAFIWAIIYSVYSIWARGPCPQDMRKEPDFFLSQFRYAKLNETISNTKLYAFDDAFTHVTHYTQWNLSVYYNLFQVV